MHVVIKNHISISDNSQKQHILTDYRVLKYNLWAIRVRQLLQQCCQVYDDGFRFTHIENENKTTFNGELIKFLTLLKVH